MTAIRPCPLPEVALLRRYLGGGGYADCYATQVDRPVDHVRYVEAFYTTPLFRLERWLLARCASRPSTDAEARELARGERESFAAWRVEARAADQLLLSDVHGRTRSWLMTAPAGAGTQLFFGSAVVPVRRPAGEPRMGAMFHALLGFHRMYSRALLAAAVSRLGEAG